MMYRLIQIIPLTLNFVQLCEDNLFENTKVGGGAINPWGRGGGCWWFIIGETQSLSIIYFAIEQLVKHIEMEQNVKAKFGDEKLIKNR